MMFGKSLHWLHSFIKQHSKAPENVIVPDSGTVSYYGTEGLFPPHTEYFKRSLEIYRLIGSQYHDPDKLSDLIVELLPEIEGNRLYYVTCMLWQWRDRYPNYNKLLEKGLATTNIPEFYQRRLDGTP